MTSICLPGDLDGCVLHLDFDTKDKEDLLQLISHNWDGEEGHEGEEKESEEETDEEEDLVVYPDDME